MTPPSSVPSLRLLPFRSQTSRSKTDDDRACDSFRCPFVSPPPKFIRSTLGSGRDVEAFVAIEVSNDNLVRAAPFVFEHVHRPRGFGIARIFEPDNMTRSTPR